MTKIQKMEKENRLHPVGKYFLVECEGFRGMACRNSSGEWKSRLHNSTLPKIFNFFPPVQADLPVLPDEQPAAGAFRS
jgi:hypothetical protein